MHVIYFQQHDTTINIFCVEHRKEHKKKLDDDKIK